jgi:hypothetical protein
MKAIKCKAYKSYTINISIIGNRPDIFRTRPINPDHDVRVTITQDIVNGDRRHNIIEIFTCEKKFLESNLQSRGYMSRSEVQRIEEKSS